MWQRNAPDRKTPQNQAMSIFFNHIPSLKIWPSNPFSKPNVRNLECTQWLWSVSSRIITWAISLTLVLPFTESRAVIETGVISQDIHFSDSKDKYIFIFILTKMLDLVSKNKNHIKVTIFFLYLFYFNIFKCTGLASCFCHYPGLSHIFYKL